MTRYIPETHDPILTQWNQKFRRSDHEIADEMGFDYITIAKHRNRLGLPRYTRPKMVMPYREMEREPVPPKIKQNPVKLAQQWLGKRLVERNGGFWLDGVPVSLDTVMRATNAMLKAAGMEMCLHSEKWRV